MIFSEERWNHPFTSGNKICGWSATSMALNYVQLNHAVWKNLASAIKMAPIKNMASAPHRQKLIKQEQNQHSKRCNDKYNKGRVQISKRNHYFQSRDLEAS